MYSESATQTTTRHERKMTRVSAASEAMPRQCRHGVGHFHGVCEARWDVDRPSRRRSAEDEERARDVAPASTRASEAERARLALTVERGPQAVSQNGPRAPAQCLPGARRVQAAAPHLARALGRVVDRKVAD